MNIPKVGVGVLLFDQGKVLLGKRLGSHGAETWGPPGGHLEFKESFHDCVQRELFEETRLKALSLLEGPWINSFFESENKHYISLFAIVTQFSGELTLAEPHKCLQWNWFTLDDLPHPLFLPLADLIKKFPLQSLEGSQKIFSSGF